MRELLRALQSQMLSTTNLRETICKYRQLPNMRCHTISEVIRVITTTKTYTSSSGNECTVTCHRPEIGVEITRDEYDRRLQDIGEKIYEVYLSECDKLVKTGESEKAEKLWRAAFPQLEPCVDYLGGENIVKSGI